MRALSLWSRLGWMMNFFMDSVVDCRFWRSDSRFIANSDIYRLFISNLARLGFDLGRDAVISDRNTFYNIFCHCAECVTIR